MTLSILICTMPSRYAMWGRLQTEFWQQCLPYSGQIEILSDDRMDISVGQKRNALKKRATGKYIAYHDDDDWPGSNYIKLLMEAAETDCDCASLKGIITIDGGPEEIFEHSLKYNEWRTTENEVKYERYPNHLNMIRADIAKQFEFPEINHGEDHNWSKQIHEAGVLKTEHYIGEILYYYKFISNK